MNTGNQALKDAATGKTTAIAEKKKPQALQLLQKHITELAHAHPGGADPQRLMRIWTSCFYNQPKLAECDPVSVLKSIAQSVQFGLEPGMGRAYLVPYKRTCTFVPGWKGLVELAQRSGRCAVWTGAVFDGDSFDYALGDQPFVKHRPGDEDDPRRLLYTYSIGRIKGNEWPVIEVWSRAKIEKHRDRFNKVGDSHYSYDNFEMYSRKVPLLQVLKYMPASIELEAALAADVDAEQGQAPANFEDALATYGTRQSPVTVEQPKQKSAPTPSDDAAKPAEEKEAADGPPQS